MPVQDSTERPVRRKLRLKTKLALIAALLAALAVSFVLGAVLTHRDAAPVITSELLGQQLCFFSCYTCKGSLQGGGFFCRYDNISDKRRER